MNRLLLLASTVLLVTASHAQHRFYLSTEIGGHWAAALDFNNSSNDRASTCDEFINPLYAQVDGCTAPNRGTTAGYLVEYGSAAGITGAAAFGVALRYGIHVELEYLSVSSDYGEGVQPSIAFGATGGKLTGEIVAARERVAAIGSSNLMLNGYYRHVSQGSRLSYYAGAGFGLSHVVVHYSSVWARNPDPSRITTGEGLINVDEIRANLAGTVSAGDGRLTNSLLGWQIVVGADYQILERVSVGLRLRRVTWGEFSSTQMAWVPLRSHDPNLRLDGSEPVHAIVTTQDLGVISSSVVLRYWF